MDGKMLRYKAVVAILSLLLMIMVIPHTLEDFALGEPAKNGIPILILQVVVALLVAVLAL